MPYYANNINNCHSVIQGALEGTRSQPLAGYSETDREMSPYSPHCALVLVYSHGSCAGCRGDRDLVNDYCGVCRACGANEDQDVDTRRMQRIRSASARRNSSGSTWRVKR